MKTPHTVLLSEYLGGDESNILAFKEAGDELVEFVARGEKYSWYENFLRPIGFLYRHYLELELKYWIKELKKGRFDQVKCLLKKHNLRKLWPELKPLIDPFCGAGDQIKCLLKQHNLRKLWLELKPLIQPFCVSKEDQKVLSEVEEAVLIFNKYDPTGQEFRYTRTTKDISTLRNLPRRIDVKEVKRLIGRVSFFFDGLGGVVSV